MYLVTKDGITWTAAASFSEPPAWARESGVDPLERTVPRWADAWPVIIRLDPTGVRVIKNRWGSLSADEFLSDLSSRFRREYRSTFAQLAALEEIETRRPAGLCHPWKIITNMKSLFNGR